MNDINSTLWVIRRAPLRTLDDCMALLAATVSRFADFERDNAAVDLSAVLDALADAEHEMEQTYATPADALEAYEAERVDAAIDEAKERRAA